jgi:peptidoglycan hydrolase CwlO-like protein
MKVHSLGKTTKQKLAALLPSTDPCVVVASLAATSLLYSLAADTETAVSAALKFLSEESPFPLTTQLSVWTVLALAPRVKLEERDLENVLCIPLSATGMRLYYVFGLLIQFVDLRYHFGTQDQMKVLCHAIIQCEASYAAVAGCNFLYSIAETNPSLLVRIDQTGHFVKRALNRLFTTTDPEIVETLLVVMMILIDSSGIAERTVPLLIEYEESLFMNFLRHVENSEAFLAVAFLSFLVRCSREIPKWLQRVKRILVESQFPALLVHVLSSSLNRRAVSDALRAVQFFVNECDPPPALRNSFFFDAAVSGFLVINQNNRDRIGAVEIQLEQEKRDFAILQQQLELEKTELKREKIDLQAELDRERERLRSQVDSSDRSTDELERRNQEIRQLNEEISRMHQRIAQMATRMSDRKEKLRSARTYLEDFGHQNSELLNVTKKLEGAELENRSLKKANAQMEVKIQELEGQLSAVIFRARDFQKRLKTIQRELEERDDHVAQLQDACNQSQKRNKMLHESLQGAISERAVLADANERMRSEVGDLSSKNSELSSAVTTLETANLEIRRQVKSVDTLRDNHRKKKAELKKRIGILEKEKRKWETVAKFVQRVGTVKGEALTDVFGPLETEP